MGWTDLLDSQFTAEETFNQTLARNLKDNVIYLKERPAFRVYSTSSTELDWSIRVFDKGNKFDLINYYYVIPSDGLYLFYTQVTFLNTSGIETIFIRKNSTSIATGKVLADNSGDNNIITINQLEYCETDDQIDVFDDGFTPENIVAGSVFTYFFGYKLAYTPDP